MNRLVSLRLLAAALFCFAFAPSALSEIPLYWQSSIAGALDVRDAYYRRLGFGEHSLRKLAQEDAGLVEAASSVPSADADTALPWHHLVHGAKELQRSPDAARERFDRAVSAAALSPGALWVLFVELHGLGQHEPAQECLSRLQETALAAGATSVEVIAQQLLAVARTEDDPVKAERYHDWASRFSSAQFWPLQRKAWGAMPARPLAAFSALLESAGALRHTWTSQLELAYLAHRALRTAAAVLVVACLVAFSIGALPSALHPLAELYPVALSPWLRHTLAVAAYLSVAAFGFYPFLVLTSVLLWPHVRTAHRPVLTVCIVLLAAAPLDSRLSDMLNSALHPARPVSLYRRAMYEGYNPDVDVEIARYRKRHSEDYLGAVAAAVSRYKANDLEGAARHIHAAERMQDDDPVVLIVSGVVQHALGNFAKAEERFRRCTELHPGYESAYFNLGQCRVAARRTITGTDLYKQAREVAQKRTGRRNRVDAFLADSDRFFGERNVRLRQTMLPRYRPADFWLGVLPAQSSSWRTAAQLWAPEFFGLGPLATAAVVLALGGLAVGAARRAGSRRAVKKLFYCVLCGMPMCRKCRAGRICVSCHNATENVSNVAIKRRIEVRITERAKSIGRWVAGVIDVLAPGAGLLAGARGPRWKALVLTALTALVYAAYVSAFTFTVPFLSGLARPLSVALFVCAAVTHLALAAGAVLRMVREHSSKGMRLWH